MKHTARSRGPWRYAFAGALFVTFGIACFAALTRQGARVIDVAVEVTPSRDGTFFIEGSDVVERLDAGPYGALVGQSVDALDLQALERFVEADPFVQKADLHTDFEGRLRVSVEQATPVLRVHDRRGADYYYADDGSVLPLSKRGAARVPVLTGDVRPFARALADSTAAEPYVLARALAADELYGPLIEQIEMRDGAYTLVPKLGRTSYLLGDLTDLPGKLHRLRAFLETVTPQAGFDAYRRVDLRYDGQVVGTRRERRAPVAHP